MVACAEGDWHSLAAQMFAELLRSRGFDVAFLVASTPVEHAEALLERGHPHALTITCNRPLFFGGVRRLADASLRHGIPVIAGGRALGADDTRAKRFGADAWGIGPLDAARIFSAWQTPPPTVSRSLGETDLAIDALEREAHALAVVAFETLLVTYPHLADYDEHQIARTKEDLEFIVGFLVAARKVGDRSVFKDFLTWLTSVLVARDVPSSAVHAGIAALVPQIVRVDPLTAELAQSFIS